MSSRLPNDFIDGLLNRIDIVEVIGRRVPLKKAGKAFSARCPFHEERTPSFTVSPDKQLYHCFGCSASGTAISFLMEFDGLNFRDAVEELAAAASVEMPAMASTPKSSDTSRLLNTIEQCNRWFKKQLRHHSGSTKAIEYLKNRGIPGQTAQEFALGFAPDGWQNLVETAQGNLKKLDLLVKAGVITTGKKGRHYDRFRSRIMLPIHDSRGRVIGFGGRILDNEDNQPKYLNSPETSVFHKSAELYNLHRARQAISTHGWALIVEGYTDVLSVSQIGINNVVATLGPTTSKIHLQKLFRIAPAVVFCFDGDKAGRDAAWKAIETAIPEMKNGRQASLLFLAEGEDPDSLAQTQGADTLRRKIKDATPLPEYLFNVLTKTIDLNRIDGRARLSDIAQPLLTKIPNGPLRELMEARLVELSGVPLRSSAPSTSGLRKSSTKSDQRLSPVATAISLLIQHPALTKVFAFPKHLDIELEASDIGIGILNEIYQIVNHRPNISSAAIVERFHQKKEIYRALKKLATRNHMLDENNVTDFYRETIGTIEAQAVSLAITNLLEKSNESDLDDDTKSELASLYKRREEIRAARNSP